MPGCLVPRLPCAPHCQFSRSTSMPFQVGDSACLSGSLRRLLKACWSAQALTPDLHEVRPTPCVSVPLLHPLTKALQSRGCVQSQFLSHLTSDPAGPSLLLQTPSRAFPLSPWVFLCSLLGPSLFCPHGQGCPRPWFTLPGTGVLFPGCRGSAALRTWLQAVVLPPPAPVQMNVSEPVSPLIKRR